MAKTEITEDYVSFETAQLLKQKGFDADCAAVYDLEFPKSCADGKLYFNFCDENPNRRSDLCSAPTLHVARKWLNKVKGISNYISCENFEERYYWVAYKEPSFTRQRSKNTFATEEKAAEDLIKYCLTNLID